MYRTLGNDPDAYRQGGDIHDALLTSSPSSVIIDTFKDVRSFDYSSTYTREKHNLTFCCFHLIYLKCCFVLLFKLVTICRSPPTLDYSFFLYFNSLIYPLLQTWLQYVTSRVFLLATLTYSVSKYSNYVCREQCYLMIHLIII